MGKTRLHTELAKCKNGVMDWNDASIITHKYYDRLNFDVGEMKEMRIKLKEKIIDREIPSYIENAEEYMILPDKCLMMNNVKI